VIQQDGDKLRAGDEIRLHRARVVPAVWPRNVRAVRWQQLDRVVHTGGDENSLRLDRWVHRIERVQVPALKSRKVFDFAILARVGPVGICAVQAKSMPARILLVLEVGGPWLKASRSNHVSFHLVALLYHNIEYYDVNKDQKLEKRVHDPEPPILDLDETSCKRTPPKGQKVNEWQF
jgi:hypothetical protein